MEPETLFALEGLATAQAAAADSTAARLSQTEATYERLRAEASALNARHRWATDDELEAVLPSGSQARRSTLRRRRGSRGGLSTGKGSRDGIGT
jgi:hypothetical protein